MNIVLMVSRVTYMPCNYCQLVEECLQVPDCGIAGILVFDNRNGTVLAQGFKLIAAGAVRLGVALISNWFKIDPKIRIAKKNRIPICKTSNPHSRACLQWLRNLQPDLLLHLRTRCILKQELLQIPRLGAVNVHHGLLPETRGTMCDLRLLLQGRCGGFSLHSMIPEVDCGTIFSRTEVASAESCGKNYWTYLKQSTRLETRVVREFLEQVRESNDLPSAIDTDNLYNVPCKWYKTPKYAEFMAWRKDGWKL